MNKPEIYVTINNLHRRDVKEFLYNYKHLIQWRSDGKDSLLDIGCGPGGITHDFLIPLLPSTFTKLVGCDKTNETIDYANKNYKHPKLSYRVYDIEDDNCIIKNEHFDHITSFFSLHWMKNLPKAINNIHKILTPNGDCFLVLANKCNAYDAIYKTSIDPKWSKFLPSPDTPNIISAYYQLKDDVINDFTNIIRSSGFSEFKIDISKRTFTYTGYKEVKNLITVICNPLLDCIPKGRQDDYLNDIINTTFPNADHKHDHWSYGIRYSLIIAYAKK